MTRLSAIVIAKNEAENIADCLEGLSFVDEIVVVDSGSEDDTVKIARRFTKRVFVTEWKGYAGTKQFALERTTGEWVLWIDADERVTPELAGEIRRVVEEDRPFAGYRMPRKAYFLGRWIKHGGWYPGYVIRLFRREQGRDQGTVPPRCMSKIGSSFRSVACHRGWGMIAVRSGRDLAMASDQLR